MLDDWSHRNLQTLTDLESKAPHAVSGETLLHFDLRADNVLLGDGHVWFFDWPHACIGAAWLDVVGFIPSVTMQGGPPPEEVFGLPTLRAFQAAQGTVARRWLAQRTGLA